MADGVRRRQRKGIVTRHLGMLERLVAEEDIDAVQSRAGWTVSKGHSVSLKTRTMHIAYYKLTH